MQELAQLRWRCRRGIRELDLALTRFLETSFHALPPEKQWLFCRLLDEPDPVLLAWVLGQAQPADPELRGLIEAVRTVCRQSESAVRPGDLH